MFEEWQCVFQPHLLANAVHYLVAGLDHLVTMANISIKLSRMFYARFGIKMSLGKFRQYIAFLEHSNKRLFGMAAIVMTVMDHQLEHGGDMDASHYCQDMRLPDNLDSGMFISTSRANATFHMLLGHPPDLMVALAKAQERQNQMLETIEGINAGKYVPPGMEVFQGTTGIWQGPSLAVMSGAIVEGIRMQLLPELILNQNRAAAKVHAAIMDIVLPVTIGP